MSPKHGQRLRLQAWAATARGLAGRVGEGEPYAVRSSECTMCDAWDAFLKREGLAEPTMFAPDRHEVAREQERDGQPECPKCRADTEHLPELFSAEAPDLDVIEAIMALEPLAVIAYVRAVRSAKPA